MKISMKLLACTMLTLPSLAMAQDWFPITVQQIEPAFAADGVATEVEYQPLEKAEKPWEICVSFPHMKDAYWLGVDYGIVKEAERLGVKANIVEAGGYTELSKQISQIEDCVSAGADAVVLGAISNDGLNSLIGELKNKNIPVIDLVNGVSSPDIAARSLVSFYEMGFQAGKYIADLHPAGSDEVTVGWFPGPAGAAWVETANDGFQKAIEGSAVKMLEPKYGDTGKEAQLKLVEDVLQSNPEVSYIAGTAVTIEASQGLIRERGLQDQVGLVSFYMTPGVYSGIERGFVTASTAGGMVLQARIAMDQAVRILEGKDYAKHVQPKVLVVNKDTLSDIPRELILPPEDFSPVFQVN